METKKILIWTLIVVILLGGGVFLYKVSSAKSQPTEPTQKNPDPTKNPPEKLTDQELEKYLLEKRLELKKYFVFNLGEEVKTREQAPTTHNNYRVVKNQLENDLSKLAVEYRNKLKNQGKKVVEGTHTKNVIAFLGKTFEDYNSESNREWTGKSLDEKITNKDLFIIFEKDDSFEKVYFPKIEIDREGNSYFPWNNAIRLRMKNPTTMVCEGKEKALELLKTDPVLVERV